MERYRQLAHIIHARPNDIETDETDWKYNCNEQKEPTTYFSPIQSNIFPIDIPRFSFHILHSQSVRCAFLLLHQIRRLLHPLQILTQPILICIDYLLQNYLLHTLMVECYLCVDVFKSIIVVAVFGFLLYFVSEQTCLNEIGLCCHVWSISRVILVHDLIEDLFVCAQIEDRRRCIFNSSELNCAPVFEHFSVFLQIFEYCNPIIKLFGNMDIAFFNILITYILAYLFDHIKFSIARNPTHLNCEVIWCLCLFTHLFNNILWLFNPIDVR